MITSIANSAIKIPVTNASVTLHVFSFLKEIFIPKPFQYALRSHFEPFLDYERK